MFCQTSEPLLHAFRKFSVSHVIYYHISLLSQPFGTSILNEYVDRRCSFQVALTAACVWDAKWNGIHHCSEIGRILSSLALYHSVTNFTVLSSSRHNNWLTSIDHSTGIWTPAFWLSEQSLNPSQAGCQKSCSLWIHSSGHPFKGERYGPEGKRS